MAEEVHSLFCGNGKARCPAGKKNESGQTPAGKQPHPLKGLTLITPGQGVWGSFYEDWGLKFRGKF